MATSFEKLRAKDRIRDRGADVIDSRIQPKPWNPAWTKFNSGPVKHLVKDGKPTSEWLMGGSSTTYANRSFADKAWRLEVSAYAKEGWEGVLRVRALLKDARIRLGH